MQFMLMSFNHFISRMNKSTLSMEHHFRIEIFIATVDQELHELNNRFSEQTTKLLILSGSLSPKGGYRSFKVDDICKS